MSSLAETIAGAIEGVKRHINGDTDNPPVTMQNKDGADAPSLESK